MSEIKKPQPKDNYTLNEVLEVAEILLRASTIEIDGTDKQKLIIGGSLQAIYNHLAEKYPKVEKVTHISEMERLGIRFESGIMPPLEIKKPREYTIDEIVQIWKEEKVVYVVTRLGKHKSIDREHEGDFHLYNFINKTGNEELLRKALSTHKTPLYRSKLTTEEYEIWGEKNKDNPDLTEAHINQVLY